MSAENAFAQWKIEGKVDVGVTVIGITVSYDGKRAAVYQYLRVVS